MGLGVDSERGSEGGIEGEAHLGGGAEGADVGSCEAVGDSEVECGGAGGG